MDNSEEHIVKYESASFNEPIVITDLDECKKTLEELISNIQIRIKKLIRSEKYIENNFIERKDLENPDRAKILIKLVDVSKKFINSEITRLQQIHSYETNVLRTLNLLSNRHPGDYICLCIDGIIHLYKRFPIESNWENPSYK